MFSSQQLTTWLRGRETNNHTLTFIPMGNLERPLKLTPEACLCTVY